MKLFFFLPGLCAVFAYYSIVVKHAPQSRHLQYLLVKSSTGCGSTEETLVFLELHSGHFMFD